MTKPISSVIVTFKALPGVRVQPVPHYAENCAGEGCILKFGSEACMADDENPAGNCGARNYIWREVPAK